MGDSVFDGFVEAQTQQCNLLDVQKLGGCIWGSSCAAFAPLSFPLHLH